MNIDFNNRFLNGLGGWGFSFRQSQLTRYRKYIKLLKNVDYQNKSVLEVGCNDGFFTVNFLKKLFQDIEAIDISSSAIEVAQNRYPKISFNVDSMPHLTSIDKNFDFITLLECLYYLSWDEQLLAINRVYDLLNNGGYVLISVHIGPEPYYTKEKMVKLFREKFEIVREDDMCIKTYYSAVETPLWRILDILQPEFWKKEHNLNSRLKRLIKAALDNPLARNTYNPMLSWFIKSILYFMPIGVIDYISRKIDYEANLSVYMVLAKKL